MDHVVPNSHKHRLLHFEGGGVKLVAKMGKKARSCRIVVKKVVHYKREGGFNSRLYYVKFVIETLMELKEILGFCSKALACLGRGDRVRGAFDELNAKIVLKAFDAVADGRRRLVEDLGGGGEASELNGNDKRAQGL